MLENIMKVLKKKKFKPEFDEEQKSVFFEYKYEDASIPCAFMYDEEQNITRFYSELAQFDQDTRGEAILVCQLLNYDTVVLKFYMGDDNILIAEYYVFGDDLPEETVEQVTVDLENIYDTMEPYFE